MPEFSVIKRFRQNKQTSTPQIKSYKIEKDKSFLGHKVNLFWRYDVPDILGFKVWRARSQKVLLRRDYVLNQRALEKISGIKNTPQANPLFNRQFFSQNSRVSFFKSDSNRYNKPDEALDFTSVRFTEVGFIPRNKGGKYNFCDRRVKFGESYLYVISAINSYGFESPRSNQCTVIVEDLDFPDPPEFSLSEGPNAIIVTIGTGTKANDVRAFHIFRNDTIRFKEGFKRIAVVDVESTEFLTFLDFETIPGREYQYKVYSEDIYGNLSYTSKTEKIVYSTTLESKGDIPEPEVNISVDENHTVTFTARNNHSGVLGLRVERKDVWRFENGFSLKDKRGVRWAGMIPFVSGAVVFEDQSAIREKVYQYRISTIKHNSQEASYLVSPHIRVTPGFEYTGSIEPDFDPGIVFNRFLATVEDSKQDPVYTNFSWSIDGRWDYMVVDLKNPAEDNKKSVGKFVIDNIPNRNSIHSPLLKEGFSYEVSAEIYLGDEKIASSSSGLTAPGVIV